MQGGSVDARKRLLRCPVRVALRATSQSLRPKQARHNNAAAVCSKLGCIARLLQRRPVNGITRVSRGLFTLKQRCFPLARCVRPIQLCTSLYSTVGVTLSTAWPRRSRSWLCTTSSRSLHPLLPYQSLDLPQYLSTRPRRRWSRLHRIAPHPSANAMHTCVMHACAMHTRTRGPHLRACFAVPASRATNQMVSQESLESTTRTHHRVEQQVRPTAHRNARITNGSRPHTRQPAPSELALRPE